MRNLVRSSIANGAALNLCMFAVLAVGWYSMGAMRREAFPDPVAWALATLTDPDAAASLKGRRLPHEEPVIWLDEGWPPEVRYAVELACLALWSGRTGLRGPRVYRRSVASLTRPWRSERPGGRARRG